MLSKLALFLRNNVYGYKPGIDDDVVDTLLVAISSIERLLAATINDNKSVYYANELLNIFDQAIKNVERLGQSDKKNQDSDKLLFWAHVLADSALLQALMHMVSDNKALLGLSGAADVLKSLDLAIIVGGASQGRLCWIHRMIDLIEEPMPPIPSSKANIDCASVSADLKYPITRYATDNMDLYAFQRMIRDPLASRPFVIENAVDQWPALSSRPWANLEYLRVVVGHNRLVPVELGAKYTDSDWTQELMAFGRFIDEIVYPSTDKTGKSGYMAQHDLASQAPRLRRDFWIPDYTLVDTGRYIQASGDGDPGNGGVQTNVWFGPKGTVSPLHYDRSDNLFVQVVGCKYFRFYSPEESRRIYAHSQCSLLQNTSQVDVGCPDLAKYPLFEQAQYTECVVRPGDMLYIPPKWWHYVQSLTISASISFWF